LQLGGLVERQLAALRDHLPLGDRIVECWLDPASQATAAWTSHVDIHEVMLVTSLLPDGYLTV
jgi:hypothetical protein